MRTISRLAVALVGLALALTGLGGFANQAGAAPGTQTGTISVHKLQGAPDPALPNDGTQQNISGRTPLEGIKFDVYLVEGVDPSTNDGAGIASKISNMPITTQMVAGGQITVDTTNYRLVTKATGSTNAQGNATFSGLDLGLYVVVEDLAGSNPVGVARDAITPAAPFVVALPFDDPANAGQLLYEAHVYPKNQVNEVTKSVQDAGVRVGGEFTYTLTTTPVLGDSNGDGKVNAADIGRFEFQDQLPANVSFVSADVTIGGTAAAAGDYTATNVSGMVTIKFTQDGIEKIAAGGQIKALVKVRLDSVPANGITANKATLVPNEHSAGITSNEVQTKHGDIVIHKVDASSTSTNLSGAVFAVHLGNDANCTSYADTPIVTSDPTDANGLVRVADLQLSNFVDGATVDNTYCLVETVSPAGYQLLREAVPFKLTAAGTVTDVTAENAGSKVQITNHRTLRLPLTGGAGIVLISVVGVAVLAIGVAALAGGLTVATRKGKKN